MYFHVLMYIYYTDNNIYFLNETSKLKKIFHSFDRKDNK